MPSSVHRRAARHRPPRPCPSPADDAGGARRSAPTSRGCGRSPSSPCSPTTPACRCVAASSVSTSSSSSPASSSPGCSSPSSTRAGRSRGCGSCGRRIRRLLPAAVLVLVLTVGGLVVRGARSAPSRRGRRHRGGRRLRRQLGVRPSRDRLPRVRRAPSPVQHFWSLAVEEQFYVVWPLLLIVLALVVRRPSRRVVALALGHAWSPPRSCGRCGSRTPRLAPPSSPPRRAPGSSASAPCSRSPSRAGRGRGTPARGSAALGWAALVALVAVALWAADRHRRPGAWACSRRCRRRCSSGSAGRVRRTARYACWARADG